MPLPKGWEIKRLGDIAMSEKGKKPKNQFNEKTDKCCYPYIDIEAFEKGIIKSYTDGIKCVLCDENDFLMVWDGSRSGLVGKGVKGALGSTLVRISLPDVNNLYAYYFLLSKYKEINTRAKGSGTPHVDPDLLWNYAFPIPPTQKQQQAIVDKIESLFAEIDAGIACLKTAGQQLKQYRQALLKNAFNGELTKQWRLEHADSLPSEKELLAQIQTARQQHHDRQLADWQTTVKQWEQTGKQGKKPSKPKAPTQAVKFEEGFADLPSGWGVIKINQVADIFTGATPLKSNPDYYNNGSIPWITSGSLNNEFVSTPDNFVTDLALKETNLKLLPKHTLLVAMYGEGKTRGKCSELLIEATTNQAIAGIVINEKLPINRNFLKFYMFKNYADIRRQSSGGVQPNLNLSLIGNIIFPFPCLAEQTQIVAVLESKLTACDQLAAELDKQLKQAELLKQAVLKAAFSGRLSDDFSDGLSGSLFGNKS